MGDKGFVGKRHQGARVRPVWTSILVLVGGLLALGLVSCAAPKVRTTMLLPAKSHEVSKIKRIAVMPFPGQEGEQVSRDIEALLVRARVQDSPYFTVIERTALQRVMQEQALHLSGAIDEKTAVTVGKLAGAEGIVLGAVTASAVEDTGYSEGRSRCVAQDERKRCIRWQQYTVSCTKRDAYFAFTPKVISVATGQILVAESLAGRAEAKWCQDSGQPPDGRMELLGGAKGQAMQKFRELVAPYYMTVEIAILEKDDTKPPPAAAEKIAAGIKWAKEGRLDRACELWHEAYSLHPQGYAIHYNLGLCAELTGKLADALERYEKADRLTGDPVKEISAARGRVRVRLEREKKLEEQMRKASPATFPSPSTPPAPDSEIGRAMQLAVKPIRANLREQPSMTARVLLTLPQGTRLEKLDQQSDWVKVRAPNGTVGWMSTSLVSGGR